MKDNHETIALAFSITQEAIEDNLYMSMGSKYARALARSMQHTKEIKAAAVLNNAFNGAYVGGDGVSLLSANHPLSGGGVQSNLLATPADISEAALEDILVQIRKTRDDRGIPIALKAIELIIPPELEFVASRLLNSTLRPGTGDNDVNAINRKGVFGRDPIVITRLTDADAWFIKTDAPEGLKFFTRVAVNTKTEDDFSTGNFRFKSRERYSCGYTSPWALFGSSGS